MIRFTKRNLIRIATFISKKIAIKMLEWLLTTLHIAVMVMSEGKSEIHLAVRRCKLETRRMLKRLGEFNGISLFRMITSGQRNNHLPI